MDQRRGRAEVMPTPFSFMGAALMLNAGGAWVGVGAWSPAVAYAASQCGIDYDRWNLEPPDDRASTVVELIR